MADASDNPTEVSAGVLLYREGEGERLWLIMHSRKGHWDFAKGHLDDGETIVQAALREMAEETGIARDQVQIHDGYRGLLQYPVTKKDGRVVDKDVHYLLGRSRTDRVTLSREHTDYAWLPLDDAEALLSFPDARALLESAVAYLDGSG